MYLCLFFCWYFIIQEERYSKTSFKEGQSCKICTSTSQPQFGLDATREHRRGASTSFVLFYFQRILRTILQSTRCCARWWIWGWKLSGECVISNDGRSWSVVDTPNKIKSRYLISQSFHRTEYKFPPPILLIVHWITLPWVWWCWGALRNTTTTHLWKSRELLAVRNVITCEFWNYLIVNSPSSCGYSSI